jgi:heterodisulfide reductase subunit A-like polyferredoxin
MKRDRVLNRIENTKEPWDFLVIGGGATGLGVGVDAAARGYSILLVEQTRFCQGHVQPQYEAGTRRGSLFKAGKYFAGLRGPARTRVAL